MIKNIFKGWYRFLFVKQSQMAKDRLLVCSICPIRYKSLCTACGCEIHAKAEIEDEECPRGYWNTRINCITDDCDLKTYKE